MILLYEKLIQVFVNRRRTAMRKALCVFISLAMIITAGCYRRKDETPYGYKTAKDYAEVWCGPCKVIDEFTAAEHDDGSKVEITVMEDTEYGFTYRVEAMNTAQHKKAWNYMSGEFDYEYLKVFLEKTDYSELIEKYDLTIKLSEPEEAYTEGMIKLYLATINFYSGKILTQEEQGEILGFTYDALQEFDKDRKHFTRVYACPSVYMHIYCQPTEKEAETGKRYGGESGRYGYKPEK